MTLLLNGLNIIGNKDIKLDDIIKLELPAVLFVFFARYRGEKRGPKLV